MVRRQVAMSALRVSLVVGTVLNIVNQGHALWQGEAADWPRLTLNFAVPFLVSSYSGARIFTAAAAEG